MMKSMHLATWLVLVLILMPMTGCERRTGAPEMRVTPGHEPHIKIVDGYLHVAHSPCPPSMVAPPAPITLTDLFSSSTIYLNGDGSINATQKPDYKTEEGRAPNSESACRSLHNETYSHFTQVSSKRVMVGRL